MLEKNTVKAKQGLLLDEDQNIDEIKGFTVNHAKMGSVIRFMVFCDTLTSFVC